ncbi:DUF4317 domain-containing protein [Caldifermentibacillus hisashii]|uniref:DUF4317 domain-containing protein n=1 Tax=Caldifermentibacillus hisashii TaxID=996558 RepID=UPI0031B6A39A
MNVKDIANIRKQFKLDNHLLQVKDIFNVYIRKESSEIFYQECHPFPMLDREQQELFMLNFKKVLTGQLDVKLFELKFQAEAEAHSKDILYEAIQNDDVESWKSQMLLLVEKMVKDIQYEKDIVITFIRGEYYKPTKRTNEETEEHANDSVYTHPFILCSINRTEQPKKSLLFDFVELEFKANVVVDSIINLTSPMSGFLFPCFTENYTDINHILYSTGKANQPDYHIIEDVLNAEPVMTAQDDKAVFEEIVKEVVGEEVEPSTLSNVYEEINRMMEEEEEQDIPKLDYKDVEQVLKASGVEDVNPEKVGMAFQKVIDDEKYELKATSLVPKSIKIQTKVANISISPQDLKYVKQVTVSGKRCILIEVDEDAVIEGFKLIPETLLS